MSTMHPKVQTLVCYTVLPPCTTGLTWPQSWVRVWVRLTHPWITLVLFGTFDYIWLKIKYKNICHDGWNHWDSFLFLIFVHIHVISTQLTHTCHLLINNCQIFQAKQLTENLPTDQGMVNIPILENNHFMFSHKQWANRSYYLCKTRTHFIIHVKKVFLTGNPLTTLHKFLLLSFYALLETKTSQKRT